MIREDVKRFKWRIFHLLMDMKVRRIRKKDTIRFLFILQEVTQWKTERLYQAMRAHPRFEPVLGITKCPAYPGAEEAMVAYCKEKNYPYVRLDSEKTISEQIDADIVTHQKPYVSEINPAHYFDSNRKIPIVSIPYYLSTITENWIVNNRINLQAWRLFIDNESTRKVWAATSRLQGLNYRVTGLPVMDELLTPKESLPDVWPVQDGRKRVIYAPHHTIADNHLAGIAYSTFLEHCEEMLALRDQFKDRVYFVFKPHPSLRKKLLEYWGLEKTNTYYRRWEEPGISHVELGKYLALFKYSDAMIHDCGSFTVEYLFTGNPVMYLVRDDCHAANMTPYAKEAFDLHYKGKTFSDIERFLEDVVAGNDPLMEKRAVFKEENLVPPNGKSACENIINAILGDNEYR